MPLRIAAIGIGYVLYRALEGDHSVVTALFVAFGTVILLYSAINRYGLWRKERSGMLQVGQTILGLGLLGIGLVLLLG